MGASCAVVKQFDHVHDYFDAVQHVMARFPTQDAVKLRQLVKWTVENNHTVFVAGNGGSGTVADHFALGMSLNVFRETGRQGRAVCLNSGTMMSAAVNDFGAEQMFSVQLETMAQSKDLFLALSASGCSKNLVTAVKRANALGLRTAAIVGVEGPIAYTADISVILEEESAAVSEDVTMMMLHWLYGSFMVKS